MGQGLGHIRYTPKLAVFAPLVALSAIFAGLAAVLIEHSRIDIRLMQPALVSGVIVYCATIGVLIRFGLANVAKLEDLGLTDSLSHLPNRRALHLDAVKASRPGQEVALALIDLDGFKLVNDHYGHFVGDRLIKEMAVLLQELCGKEGRVYRLGGDEFALVVLGPIAGNILEGICRKLLARLSKPIFIDDRAVVVGASVGLARCANAAEIRSSELLRRTDMAMYASKRAGKMRCTWFNEEFDRRLEEIQQIDGELRQALSRDEFHLHYQPLVGATHGKVVGVEALLRWERRDGQRIGPHIFIPIAEESGVINAIGLWVLRRACTDALPWEGINLSVNVSAAQLRNPEFPIDLGHILEETGFPAHRLELEVTETHLVQDTVTAGRSLELIREFGVGIVLDDFGTGYASIGFLRKFRFEKLKLHRSLVVEATRDVGSRAMMLASIAVARSLDMDVTAEGVETEEQADLVRTAGCDQIQGWLYFKAMPAEDVTMHLRTQANDLENARGIYAA